MSNKKWLISFGHVILALNVKIVYYKSMQIESIQALEKALKERKLLKKYSLERIGIFGSFARGEKANDIDFYIDSENYDIKKIIHLKKDLENVTEKEIDIMVKKYANPIILYRAQKDMKYVTQ
jgi:predicted nucleotidyltransferase